MISVYESRNPGPLFFEHVNGDNRLSYYVHDLVFRIAWDPDAQARDGASRVWPGASRIDDEALGGLPMVEFSTSGRELSGANPDAKASADLQPFEWISGDASLKGAALARRSDKSGFLSWAASLGTQYLPYSGDWRAELTDGAGAVKSYTRYNVMGGWLASPLTCDLTALTLTGSTGGYWDVPYMKTDYKSVKVFSTLTAPADGIFPRACGYAPVIAGFDAIITKCGDGWIAHNADGTVDYLTRRSAYLSQFSYSTVQASPILSMETRTHWARVVTTAGVYWARWDGFAFRDFRKET